MNDLHPRVQQERIKVMTDFLKAMVISAVMGEGAKSWPTFAGATLNRAAYLTASEAGKCIRQLSFDKLEEFALQKRNKEITDDEFSWLVESQTGTSPDGYFQRGHNVEAWVVEQILAVAENHELFMFMGDDQVSFYDTRTRVSGTPDGFLYDKDNGEFWLLEFKSVGSQVYSPRSEHVRQCQVNMGLISHIASDKRERYSKLLLKLFAEKGVNLSGKELPKWSGVKLLYVQSSNYFDMKEFSIDYDGGVAFKEAVEKSKKLFSGKEEQIQQLARPAELPPEGIEQKKCVFCAHKNACRNLILQQDGEDLVKFMDKSMGMTPLPDFKSNRSRSELLADVDTYATNQIKMQDLKKEQDEMKDGVKNFIFLDYEGKYLGATSHGKYKVTVNSSDGRSSLDKGAMIKDGIDLDKYTKIGDPYTSMTIKRQ